MSKPKPPRTAQSKRFIEAARNAECSEDEAAFDEAMKQIAKAKPKPDSHDEKK